MGLIWGWITDNWISVFITSVIIPVLFILISYVWYNHISVLKITPEVKYISCSNKSYRRETFYVYLTNNSSNPIYDINVISHHPREVDVSIYPDKGHSETIPFGNINMGTSFSIHGYDLKNVGFSQTVINNLAPKETIKLSVEINKKDYYNNFTLKTEAKFNSKTPKPILTTR